MGSISLLLAAELAVELQRRSRSEEFGVFGRLCYGVDRGGRSHNADQATGW